MTGAVVRPLGNKRELFCGTITLFASAEFHFFHPLGALRYNVSMLPELLWHCILGLGYHSRNIESVRYPFRIVSRIDIWFKN